MSGPDGSVPRLLASDLDGTLLNAQSLVSDRTAAAVRWARDAGIEVVAATGRSHRTASPLLAPTGAFRWAICSNGATLFDVETQAVVGHNFLDPSIARAVATLADALPGAGFAWETPDGLFRDETNMIGTFFMVGFWRRILARVKPSTRGITFSLTIIAGGDIDPAISTASMPSFASVTS